MQSDLPWNVAGIPPEAREAARAAARREGLSVGEWLTRRILRSLTDTEPAGTWRRDVDYSDDDFEDTPAAAAPQRRAVARAAEPEPTNVYRRIEEQLRNLGKRLEAQEKTHAESSRAVSQAAAEINSAARDQAQAFEHMGSHVVGLSERLARVERDAPSDGFKEAVKSLHAGLTRLAEQITANNSNATNQISALASKLESVAGNTSLLSSKLETVAGNTNLLSNKLEAVAGNTHQSAGQIAALSGKLEAVAGKIGDVRSEAEHSARTLTGKLEAVAGKISDVRNEAEHSARALAQRIASFDDRVRASEAASQALADRLDKTIAGLEAARNTRAADQAESARQALLITQLSDTLHGLSQRISSSEAQTAGAMARVEHQIVESRHSEQPVDRRLQGIEQALSDIAGRLDRAERSTATSARTVEDNLRNVSARLDAADKRHHEAISELQTAVSQPPPPPVFAVPPAPSISPSATSLVTPSIAAVPVAAATPISPLLDLPPFPEAKDPETHYETHADAPEKTSAPEPTSEPIPATTSAPEPIPEPISAPTPETTSATTHAAEEPLSTDGLPIIPGPQHSETADSYIAAARRSARAATATDAAAQPGMRGTIGGFSWGAPPTPLTEQPAEKTTSPRYVLVGGIVAIIVAAIVAGILLSRGLVGGLPSLMPHLPARHHAARAATPTFATARPATVVTRVASVIGSPVIPMHPATSANTTSANTTSANVTDTASAQAAKPAPTPTKPVASLDKLAALATAGNAKAELLVGLRYLDGNGVAVNEAEAAKWLERAARAGQAIAAYRLGTLYERGHGVPADAAKAIQWYSTAAKLGNLKAMHNLAVAYAEGSGTPKDLTQAAQWFSKAAALGLADSQFNLAVLYERGMGVQQSLIDAFKWYAIAAQQGDAESKARLEVLSTQLNADERAAAQKAANDFHQLPLDRNANVPPDPTSVG